MKKGTKRIGLILAILLGILLVTAVGYCIYVFAAYHRIADNQTLSVIPAAAAEAVEPNTEYTFTTYNIGFGAYSSDYSFFMDGGTESWAFSKQAVLDNTASMLSCIEEQKPDFSYFQEVDLDSTRSYHVNQFDLISAAFPASARLYAVDYDSPFLFYPFTQPHGRSVSSIATLSRFPIESAVRRSLPIDQGLSKLLDLDRCFSVSTVPVSNGKTLYLYNVHMSAYSKEAGTVESQVKLLSQDIESRYAGGNYIIVGGDFNQDLYAGDSAETFGWTQRYDWAQPFPAALLPDSCHIAQPTETSPVIPSCRNADAPYVKGETFVILIDGFIVSDNITVSELGAIDTGFAWSDHNPVKMEFALDA